MLWSIGAKTVSNPSAIPGHTALIPPTLYTQLLLHLPPFTIYLDHLATIVVATNCASEELQCHMLLYIISNKLKVQVVTERLRGKYHTLE